MSNDQLTIVLNNRGIIALSGPDAKTLLQGIITNNVGRASPTQAIYAALLTPQGKYLHDFLIIEKNDTLLLDCEADRRADLVRRLTMYRLRANVQIEDKTDELAVAAIINTEHVPDMEAATIFRDPRHDGLGFRAVAVRDRLDSLSTGTNTDYDNLRLKLGIPDGARDFQVEKTLVLEGNLDELNGVDFTKGCYVGQELTARMKHRGKVRKRLLPVTVDGPLPAPDTPVMDGKREIGIMRSGLDGRGIALVRIEDIKPEQPYTCGAARIIPHIPGWLPLNVNAA